MAAKGAQHSAVIGIIILLVVGSSASGLAYYQYLYLPTVGRGEEIPPEWVNPKENVTVRILDGSFNPSQPENYVPKEAIIVLGVNNTVIWVSEDAIPHTVTSQTNSPSREFIENASTSNYLQRVGDRFAFTFTKAGVFDYYCVPHSSWMRGKVEVLAPIPQPSPEPK